MSVGLPGGLALNGHYIISPSAWIIGTNLSPRVLTAVRYGPPISAKTCTCIFSKKKKTTMARGDISPSNTRPSFPLPSPDSGRQGPAPPPARHAHHQRQATASSPQTAIFRTAAPPLIFAVLVAGLLVELRMRLAPPPPAIPEALLPGITVRGNTVAQSALMWAEARWPGIWALPALCAGALAALRVAIWAGAAVVDGFEERGTAGPGGAAGAGVRVGRWEDGGSVSGGDLLTGVFT